MRVTPFGAGGLLVQTEAEAVIPLWRALRASPPAGVTEIVAGTDSVLLIYDGPAPAEPPPLPDPSGFVASAARTVALPVCYDGPDLEEVARLTGLAGSEVARLHSTAAYTVSFVGFSPGFAYLAGVDDRLAVRRLENPRTSVPAGSVAVAAGMTAVYPQSTPGGWRLIGRTDAVLFDPDRSEPSLLSPGDRVRFVPSHQIGSVKGWADPSANMGSRARGLSIIGVDGLVTMQDSGRAGWAHVGVPRAGFADVGSAGWANTLVGNRWSDALLEVTLGGCRLRLLEVRTIAVTGARRQLLVDGLPARAERALTLAAGQELLLGPAEAGVHTYIAVSGGLAGPTVLGSRCRDTLSGLGPRALAGGDQVALGPEPPDRRADATPAFAPTSVPGPGETVTVRVRPGPNLPVLGRPVLNALLAAEWTIATNSDRTGARLAGPAIRAEATVGSAGMVPGAVQIPPGGQPVVLLRNHPATGGYPVAAVVDGAGVDRLAQCRPGVPVRFEPE